MLGNVGNFIYQKNHTFLIEIFKEILNKDKRYQLLLVGKGDDLEKIKEMVKKNNIEKNVTFLGVINNVENIMQAIDIFLLPSIIEGLPFVALEAQAAGIKTIMSNRITDEVMITNSIIRLPLNKEKWILEILNTNINYDRRIELLPNAENFMYKNSTWQYKKIIE